MIQFVGNGGHAAVLREIEDLTPSQNGWIIAIGGNEDRKKEALKIDGVFARLFHPSSIISISAEIAQGTVVMAGSIIQAKVLIGRHVIVNTGAQIDHHCLISDYVHIGPGAILCGGVKVGEGAFIGAGAVLTPGVVIEAWDFVKANSVRSLSSH